MSHVILWLVYWKLDAVCRILENLGRCFVYVGRYVPYGTYYHKQIKKTPDTSFLSSKQTLNSWAVLRGLSELNVWRGWCVRYRKLTCSDSLVHFQSRSSITEGFRWGEWMDERIFWYWQHCPIFRTSKNVPASCVIHFPTLPSRFLFRDRLYWSNVWYLLWALVSE